MCIRDSYYYYYYYNNNYYYYYYYYYSYYYYSYYYYRRRRLLHQTNRPDEAGRASGKISRQPNFRGRPATLAQ